jgi:tetratricopeptide (TPR) repeat protein
MFSTIRRSLVALCIVLFILLAPAHADEPGLEDLNEATRLKVAAERIDDLGAVIDRLDAALEKGLEKENADFARQMLVSTLMQRATTFAEAILKLSAQSQDARAALQAMRFRQLALNDLQRVVDTDAKQWEAHMMMGRLQALPMGDPGAARRAFTTVIDADDTPAEDRAEALALRSAVQRDPERQMADMNRAVELQPEKPDYHRLRAQYRYTKEKFDEALADIDRAIKLDENHVSSHELRGMILLGMQRFDDALAAFDRAGELEPDSAMPYQRRSQLFRQQGDLNKAAEQLSKAIEISPDSIVLLLLRAGVYVELKDYDKALADIEQAIRIQPQVLQPHLMRAEIYAVTDRIDKAIEDLERLTQLAPGQPLVLTQLATFYMIANKPRKAIEPLSQVIKLDPDDVRAIRLRGDAYLNVGQHADAITDFNRALELQDEPDDGLLNNFAWVLATSPDDEQRDGKRAIELATRADEATNYETPHILSTLAAAYAETGDFDRALVWSQKAVEVSQKAIDAATDEEERAKLQKDHEQLAKEVESYRQKKPWRERQSVGEEPEAKSGNDQPDAAAETRPDRTADKEDKQPESAR